LIEDIDWVYYVFKETLLAFVANSHVMPCCVTLSWNHQYIVLV